MSDPSVKLPPAELEPADEAYSLGDVGLAPLPEETSASRRQARRGRGGALPWVLLVLLSGVIGVGAVQVVLPMRERLLETERTLGRLTNEHAELQAALTRASQDQAELKKMRDALVVELEQKTAALGEVQRAQEELARKLADEVEKGEIAITQSDGQLSVDLSEQILFDSGAAELNERGKSVLRQVGETLVKLEDKVLQIGGHTDAVPISPKLHAQFASNWELSTARATHVVRFLQDEVKVPGERLVASGFSEYRPAASNATPAGRRKNRRIEVKLVGR